MRRGVLLLGLIVLVAALGAAVARADSGTGTTTTGTTDTTTTDTTTTSPSTTETTTTTTGPTYVPLMRSRLPHGCVGAGVAAIAKPGGAIVMLDVPAKSSDASKYPASHPFLTTDSATASGSGCTNRRVTLTNVSLF